jgi:hypothetical protein
MPGNLLKDRKCYAKGEFILLMKREKLEEDFYREQLFKLGYFKTLDGKQLYELNLIELEQIYENEKCRKEVLQ